MPEHGKAAAMTSVLPRLLRPDERSPSDLGDGDLLYATTTYALRGVGVRKRILVPQEMLRTGGFGARDIFEDEDVDAAFAFVSLPFRRDEPAEIIIPEVMTRLESAAPAPERPAARSADADPRQRHGSVLRIRADSTPDAWCRRVERLVERLRSTELEKAVLARRITVTADEPFSKSRFLRALATSFRAGVVFAFGGYLGVSPELLVRRNGRIVSSRPLAGTLPRGQNEAEDEAAIAALLNSPRFLHEHGIVVEHIVGMLKPILSELVLGAQPAVLTLPTVHHLATSIDGCCDADTDVLRLAAELHPTPAVCGSPTSQAYAAIEELEGWRRGLYAGAVGWVDRVGDGEF